MLRKLEEIECVKNAWEPGIQDPSRPQYHFDTIATCFFNDLNLQGSRVLDLGPGHYDFCHAITNLGATAVGYELDPAVIKLGGLKGFEVIEGNVYDIEKLNSLKECFDGLFCRGSFNSRNFEDGERHKAYLSALIAVVKPGGFHWISPCNDPIGELNEDQEFSRIVSEQIDFFRDEGFQIFADDYKMISAFGISSTDPKLLFTKGFKIKDVDIYRNIKRS